MASVKTRKVRGRAQAHSRRVKDMTSDELRTLIETLIDHKFTIERLGTQRPITAEMRRRAISAAGRFRSGQADVSIRHDDHLIASYSQ
jgi:hypothetical protein